jgi:hypothetical protein
VRWSPVDRDRLREVLTTYLRETGRRLEWQDRTPSDGSLELRPVLWEIAGCPPGGRRRHCSGAHALLRELISHQRRRGGALVRWLCELEPELEDILERGRLGPLEPELLVSAAGNYLTLACGTNLRWTPEGLLERWEPSEYGALAALEGPYGRYLVPFPLEKLLRRIKAQQFPQQLRRLLYHPNLTRVENASRVVILLHQLGLVLQSQYRGGLGFYVWGPRYSGKRALARALLGLFGPVQALHPPKTKLSFNDFWLETAEGHHSSLLLEGPDTFNRLRPLLELLPNRWVPVHRYCRRTVLENFNDRALMVTSSSTPTKASGRHESLRAEFEDLFIAPLELANMQFPKGSRTRRTFKAYLWPEALDYRRRLNVLAKRRWDPELLVAEAPEWQIFGLVSATQPSPQRPLFGDG